MALKRCVGLYYGFLQVLYWRMKHVQVACTKFTGDAYANCINKSAGVFFLLCHYFYLGSADMSASARERRASEIQLQDIDLTAF